MNERGNDYLEKLNREYPEERSAAHEAYKRIVNDPEEKLLGSLDGGTKEEGRPLPEVNYPVYDPKEGDPEEKRIERMNEGEGGEEGDR